MDWRHAKLWTIQHLGQFARIHDVVLGCRRANHPERSHVATASRRHHQCRREGVGAGPLPQPAAVVRTLPSADRLIAIASMWIDRNVASRARTVAAALKHAGPRQCRAVVLG